MRLKKKFILAGIFSLVIIIISVATTRIFAITSSTGLVDPSWMYLWSAVEGLVGTKTDLSHICSVLYCRGS